MAMSLHLRQNSDMQCPMDGLLRMLMGPWTTYILWLIRSNGPQRFGQLRKQMPTISAKMLTERLRMLEEVGILHREQEETIPPKVTYSMTERGHDLNKVLDDLAKLAVKWDCPGAEKAAREKMPKKAS
ncbi:MAG: Transcriptional regulator, HxlR family [Micavibrio sp.]|nr:Transcriptional regulator, HxlR family [Micavibrio sp.]